MEVLLPDKKTVTADMDETAADVVKKICHENYKLDPETSNVLDVLAVWIFCENPASLEQQNSCEGDEAGILRKTIQPMGSILQVQLSESHKLGDVKEKLTNFLKSQGETNITIKFRLGRNVHFSVQDEEKLDDPVLLRLLYLEASDHVNRGLYPLKPKQRIDLLSIQQKIDEEYYMEQKKHFVDLVMEASKTLPSANSLHRYYRNFRLRKQAQKCSSATLDVNYKPGCETEDEQVSLRSHENVSRKEIVKLYQDYLKKCHRYVPCYGAFLFGGQMERSVKQCLLDFNYFDKIVNIAINQKGLHIIDLENQKILHSIEFNKLNYGILTPKMKSHHHGLFIKTDENKTEQIFTRHASFINKTLTQFQRIGQLQMES